eukprot:3498659-Heterocapsa_arctica.AAC.1
MWGEVSEELLSCWGNPSHIHKKVIRVKAPTSNFLSMETGHKLFFLSDGSWLRGLSLTVYAHGYGVMEFQLPVTKK